MSYLLCSCFLHDFLFSTDFTVPGAAVVPEQGPSICSHAVCVRGASSWPPGENDRWFPVRHWSPADGLLIISLVPIPVKEERERAKGWGRHSPQKRVTQNQGKAGGAFCERDREIRGCWVLSRSRSASVPLLLGGTKAFTSWFVTQKKKLSQWRSVAESLSAPYLTKLKY